jgi:predicted lipid carrier protein YhbT
MATAQEKMAAASAKIAANQAKAAAIGATYRFVLDGDAGGTWILALKDPPSVTAGDGAAECTVRMAAQDFVDMVEGRASGQELFFRGKLKVEGDMGLALRLQALTDILK